MDSPTTIFSQSLAVTTSFLNLRTLCQETDEDDWEDLKLNRKTAEDWIQEPQVHFKAWATNIAALHPAHLKSSLDFRLRETEQIREQVLTLLSTLLDLLSQAREILSHEVPNEWWTVGNPAKFRFEIQPDGKIKKIAPEQIAQPQAYETCQLREFLSSSQTSVANLLKLSVAIRSSPVRDDYSKAEARYDIPSFWDVQHVSEKHGNAKYSEQWLIERLGRAITLRRKYLNYREDHSKKIQSRNEVTANGGVTVALTKTHTLPSTVATAVERAAQTAVEEDEIDETARSHTTYPMTQYEGLESKTLTVPRHPKFAFEGIPYEDGKPFLCPYCFTEQNCKDRTAWKRHVFRDLKPYLCIFKDCDAKPFSSQHDWFLHEIQKHRREWACQFCEQSPFQSLPSFKNHLLAKHQNAFSKEELSELINECEEPIAQVKAADCPLCDEWETNFGKSQNNDLSKLRKHLGRHMEQLALFALPKAEADSDDDEANDEDDDGEKLSEILEDEEPSILEATTNEPDITDDFESSDLEQPMAAKREDYLPTHDSQEDREPTTQAKERSSNDSDYAYIDVRSLDDSGHSGEFIGSSTDLPEKESQPPPIPEKNSINSGPGMENAVVTSESLVKKVLEKTFAEELNPPPDSDKPIRFKDAIGRKFSFPFRLCKNWAGMDELIQQAFVHVEVVGPYVRNGHYDLVGPNGEIILKQVWETVIQPDWQITMHMWPLPGPRAPHESYLAGYPMERSAARRGETSAIDSGDDGKGLRPTTIGKSLWTPEGEAADSSEEGGGQRKIESIESHDLRDDIEAINSIADIGLFETLEQANEQIETLRAAVDRIKKESEEKEDEEARIEREMDLKRKQEKKRARKVTKYDPEPLIEEPLIEESLEPVDDWGSWGTSSKKDKKKGGKTIADKTTKIEEIDPPPVFTVDEDFGDPWDFGTSSKKKKGKRIPEETPKAETPEPLPEVKIAEDDG